MLFNNPEVEECQPNPWLPKIRMPCRHCGANAAVDTRYVDGTSSTTCLQCKKTDRWGRPQVVAKSVRVR